MEKLAQGYTLIEGPVWVDGQGLVFSDVHAGGAYCLKEDGSIETVIEYRRGIGGMALHQQQGFIVSGRNISYKGPAAAGSVVFLDHRADEEIVGFNDLTTDTKGRVYTGSLKTSPFDPAQRLTAGDLWMIDTDGSIHKLHGDILLTNGLGFSPDGKRLYHSDTRSHMVGVYEVHDDGTVGARQAFAKADDFNPDGLAVAEDGSVWVADARAGLVKHFTADGTALTPLEVSLPMVTSVCFGGSDLCQLYIVTGSAGTGRETAGSIFCTRTDVAGLPVPPARLPLR